MGGAPLLEYRFEEGTGGVVANTGSFAGGHGVRFDLNSAGSGPAFSNDIPAGVESASSLVFDGINDWVRVPDDFDMTEDGTATTPRLSTLTVEAWVRREDQTGQRVIWDDYGNPGVLLTIWDGRVQFGVSTVEHPGMGVAVYSGFVEPHAWHHIAGVYDGTSLRVYVDGEDSCARAFTSGAIDDNSWTSGGGYPIGIGADNETIPALSFAGGIDELRVHGEALDASTVANGLFAGLPDPCGPPSEKGGDDDNDRGDDDDDAGGDDDDDDDEAETQPPTATPTATPSGEVTIFVEDVSTLSGAEALAADSSCGLLAKSLQDPAGSPVQLARVVSGTTTVLTHASLRSSDISGIALDPMTGQLLIADEVGGRIALVNLATQSVNTVFDLPWVLNPGSNGTGQQQFAPVPGGTILYFWDSTRSAVFRLDRSSGALTTVYAVDQTTPAGQHLATYVNDVVFDPNTGTILLADNSSGSVLEIDPSTSPAVVTTLFSGVSMPHALALSPAGTEVYVGSSFHSVLVGQRSGGSLSLLAGGFPFVTDFVACGESVYAVDKSLDTIFRIRPSRAGGGPRQRPRERRRPRRRRRQQSR